jgi:hypothetical protein
VVDVSRFRKADRIALARLQGAAFRLARGQLDYGETEPVMALRDITTEPRLLGIAAGTLAADDHYSGHVDAVALLRQAGADMEAAAEHEEWVRGRLRRRR